MDLWFSEEKYNHSSSSSTTFQETFFDAYHGLTGFDYIAEFARDEIINPCDLGHEKEATNYVAAQTHQHLHQTSGYIDVQNQSALQDRFTTDHGLSSSSSSSSLKQGIEPTSRKFQHFNFHNSLIFENSKADEAAVTRAISALISSDSSHVNCHGNEMQPGAFKTYNNSHQMPQARPMTNYHGQKLIKAAISMMRKINRGAREASGSESSLTPNQQYHVISERRRRQKLNDSFDVLRSMLPRGCKKDKTSVLVIAKDYVNTLKTQVSDLESKNKALELRLPTMDANNINENQVQLESSNRVEIQVLKSAKPNLGMHDINLKVDVRMECDVIQLLLRILECLKKMMIVGLVAVDANTYLSRMSFDSSVSLTLQLKANNWDEQWFKENIARAVDNIAYQ